MLPRIEPDYDVALSFRHGGDKLENGSLARPPLAIHANSCGPLQWPADCNSVKLSSEWPTVEVVILAPFYRRVETALPIVVD